MKEKIKATFKKIRYTITKHLPNITKHLPNAKSPSKVKNLFIRLLNHVFRYIVGIFLFSRRRCQCCHKKIPYEEKYFISITKLSRLCEYCGNTCQEHAIHGQPIKHIKNKEDMQQ